MQASLDIGSLTFRQHGAQQFRAVIAPLLPELRLATTRLPRGRAGMRINDMPELRSLIACNGPLGAIAERAIGPGARAVRAILFDKTPETNWAVGWHQDRVIRVNRRIEAGGFGSWTIKDGVLHVEPPFEVLAKMVTLRAHLDDVPLSNAPLLIAPGSHTIGRVPIGEIEDVVRRSGTHACLANAGDIWLYATPILHASRASSAPSRRRVVQVDFASGELPGGLEWLDV